MDPHRVPTDPEDLRLDAIRRRFALAGYDLDLVPTPDGDWEARVHPQGRVLTGPPLAVGASDLQVAEDALALFEGAEPPLGEPDEETEAE
jgi:hypothetical protein